jgi:crossover junction endodeoxyribonuclease RuvC
MSEWIIGIDPGKTGAMALLRHGNVERTFVLSKGTERDAWDWLEEATTGIDHVYLEQVHAMRGDDNRKQGVVSAFSFGQSYGFLRGILIATGAPFDDVKPDKWQRAFGLIRTSKTETITQKKNRHKAKAQQLFPDEKITHAIADALLIAEYGRRLRGGTL